MLYAVLADCVLVLHISFIAFAVAGGFLALRWRWLPWLHLPAAAWGVALELGGWICPLTPLESWLREAGGGSGYQAGGFIEHWVALLVYPPGLIRMHQLVLGLLLLALNAVAYALVWRARSSKR